MMIVDLDGCISNDEWRWNEIDHSVIDPDERYHTYHLGSVKDKPANLHELVHQDRIIFTARPLRYRDITEWWLRLHSIKYELLIMRNNKDHRPSIIIKEEMLRSWLPHYNIHKDDIKLAIDDHEDIVQMYRSHGLNAKLVRIGTYERKTYSPGNLGSRR